jgi:hypothetical protein
MTEQLLGAIVVALISGIIGNIIGSKDTVKKTICDERRATCNKLLIEKIENVAEKVEALTKIVNDKHLGIVV